MTASCFMGWNVPPTDTQFSGLGTQGGTWGQPWVAPSPLASSRAPNIPVQPWPGTPAPLGPAHSHSHPSCGKRRGLKSGTILETMNSTWKSPQAFQSLERAQPTPRAHSSLAHPCAWRTSKPEQLSISTSPLNHPPFLPPLI